MKYMKDIIKRMFGQEELTEQEMEIRDIFTKLLDMPNTNKILVDSMSSYLTNSELGISAAIDGNEVIIENGDETLSIRCRSNFMSDLSGIVSKSVSKNIDGLYTKMLDKQMKRLKAINAVLDPLNAVKIPEA